MIINFIRGGQNQISSKVFDILADAVSDILGKDRILEVYILLPLSIVYFNYKRHQNNICFKIID